MYNNGGKTLGQTQADSQNKHDIERLRVAIVDDSYLIREGLVQVLSLAPGIQVTGSYADAAAFIASLATNTPDIVLTDIRMPPTHTDEGIRLAETLREQHPKIGVIVLSQFEQAEYAGELLASGASHRGYLLKDRIHDLDNLVSTIQAVAAGECRIDPRLVDELVKSRRRRRSPLDELTPRQIEILGDVAEGQSNAGIARARHLTQRAVEKHVSEIFSRLGLTDDETVSRRVRATLLYLSRGNG
jgi:DNA-binding NarL/FixJ family response regulator